MYSASVSAAGATGLCSSSVALTGCVAACYYGAPSVPKSVLIVDILSRSITIALAIE